MPVKPLPTIDFETHAINGSPAFNPPEPVGVSVRLPDLGTVYLGWGHPEGNNCTKQDAYNLLEKVWDEHVGHNATRFDIPVGMKHFGLPEPKRVEDTLYQLFLHEPLSPNLSLKPSAARLLNMPATEQDAVRQWLIAHGVVGSTDKDWGAHIAKAPGGLVGTYANGDTNRTWLLHELLYPKIIDAGMSEAYERELQLAPILNANELEGVWVDLPRLERDSVIYEAAYARVNKEIIKLLKCSPDINLNSGEELAAAIQSSGKCDISRWPKTPTGKLSTAVDNLFVAITDPKLYKLLAYRSPLHTCLTTFMRPWIIQARATGGLVHPQWNAVRGATGGTRTGRLSSFAPNFQNIPKEFDDVEIPSGYPPLPFMRVYVLPRPGEVFVSADFHSQEVRVLGHFAEGAIQQIYRDNPGADVHQVAADLIRDYTGLELTRKQVKIIAFTILYGGGVSRLAASLGVPYDHAYRMRQAYMSVLVGVEALQDDVTAIGKRGETVRSWGGRVLHGPDGRAYALVNYLIQGSAADQTKEAVIRLEEFYIQVHDEICMSFKPKELKQGIKRMRWAMEDMKGWDIPMRIEVSTGKNWHEMEKQS